jgi:hypothetical protein
MAVGGGAEEAAAVEELSGLTAVEELGGGAGLDNGGGARRAQATGEEGVAWEMEVTFGLAWEQGPSPWPAGEATSAAGGGGSGSCDPSWEWGQGLVRNEIRIR